LNLPQLLRPNRRFHRPDLHRTQCICIGARHIVTEEKHKKITVHLHTSQDGGTMHRGGALLPSSAPPPPKSPLQTPGCNAAGAAPHFLFPPVRVGRSSLCSAHQAAPLPPLSVLGHCRDTVLALSLFLWGILLFATLYFNTLRAGWCFGIGQHVLSIFKIYFNKTEILIKIFARRSQHSICLQSRFTK
jgi:hypothetical protein